MQICVCVYGVCVCILKPTDELGRGDDRDLSHSEEQDPVKPGCPGLSVLSGGLGSNLARLEAHWSYSYT